MDIRECGRRCMAPVSMLSGPGSVAALWVAGLLSSLLIHRRAEAFRAKPKA